MVEGGVLYYYKISTQGNSTYSTSIHVSRQQCSVYTRVSVESKLLGLGEYVAGGQLYTHGPTLLKFIIIMHRNETP